MIYSKVMVIVFILIVAGALMSISIDIGDTSYDCTSGTVLRIDADGTWQCLNVTAVEADPVYTAEKSSLVQTAGNQVIYGDKEWHGKQYFYNDTTVVNVISMLINGSSQWHDMEGDVTINVNGSSGKIIADSINTNSLISNGNITIGDVGYFRIRNTGQPWQFEIGDAINYFKIGRGAGTGDLEFQGNQAGFGGYIFKTVSGSTIIDIDTNGRVGIRDPAAFTFQVLNSLDNNYYASVSAPVLINGNSSIISNSYLSNVSLLLMSQNPAWAAGTLGGSIGFGGRYSPVGSELGGVISAVRQASNNYFDDWGLAFFTRNDATQMEERMRLTNDGKLGIGTAAPSYPLQVQENVSGVSIWAGANISATGYITRTSIYDKDQGSALDNIYDASYYTTDGVIDDSKFFGVITYEITDFDRPAVIKTLCDDMGKSVPCDEITYPYKKIVSGVLLDKEIDLLRQAVYELKTENERIKQTLCDTGQKSYC